MKLLVSLLVLLLATSVFAGWTSGGPTGGAVNAVVVAPSDPAVIWAVNDAGVFRSADGGATFANVSGPVVDAGFIAVHPTDPNKAWVAAGWATTARVYRTSDGGATWIDSSDGLPSIHPSALYVDRRNPDTLYLGSQCSPIGYTTGPFGAPSTPGVFKSTDGGATWRALAAPPTPAIPCAEELAIDPFSPWRLFLSGAFDDGGRQFESYDSGNSWEIAQGPRPTHGVVFDARFPFTHYGFTTIYGRHMMVSQDGGFTWREVPMDLPLSASPAALSMDPERSRIFLGTTANGVFRSGNGGSVWAKTALQDVKVSALDFGGNPPALFAATSDGLYAVANRGLGAPSRVELHDIAANVSGLAVDPSEPNIVYAGVHSSSGGVFRSTDRGATWQRLAGDDDTPKADVISVDAAGNVYALVFGAPGALYRRGRDDASWTATPVVQPYDVAADPKNAGTAFLAADLGVQRTRDGGLTWQRVTTMKSAGVVAIDPSDPRWVYAGDTKTLQRSSDGGDTWTSLQNDDTAALVVAPSNGSVLYRVSFADSKDHAERSDDRGATWRALGITQQFQAPALAVDPRDANSVWAAANLLLEHSTDGGATWQIVDPPFRVTDNATKLVFDPSGRVLHVVYPNHGVWELNVDGLLPASGEKVPRSGG